MSKGASKKSNAVATPRSPSSSHKRISVEVEKIKNGYLIHTTHSDDQSYKSETTYSKTRPKIAVPVVKGGSK